MAEHRDDAIETAAGTAQTFVLEAWLSTDAGRAWLRRWVEERLDTDEHWRRCVKIAATSLPMEVEGNVGSAVEFTIRESIDALVGDLHRRVDEEARDG